MIHMIPLSPMILSDVKKTRCVILLNNRRTKQQQTHTHVSI